MATDSWVTAELLHCLDTEVEAAGKTTAVFLEEIIDALSGAMMHQGDGNELNEILASASKFTDEDDLEKDKTETEGEVASTIPPPAPNPMTDGTPQGSAARTQETAADAARGHDGLGQEGSTAQPVDDPG